MTDSEAQSGRSLKDLLQELDREINTVKAALVYGLSDLTSEEMAIARVEWPKVNVAQRRLAIARLAEASETNYELDFSRFARYALEDSDEQVRKGAIEALWYSEDTDVMHTFINLLKNDPANSVRCAAAQGLGSFVLAGELGDIPQAAFTTVDDALLNVCREAEISSELYLRALESVAYSGNEEVSELIEETAKQEQVALQAVALFAMGRSGDERWGKIVMRSLHSDSPQLQFEAARAAGELMLEAAVPRLIELSQGDDIEIQEAAIISLGNIGGQVAMQGLTQLSGSLDNEELLDAIEDAMNMAALSTGDFASYFIPNGESIEFDGDDADDFEYFDAD